MRRLSHLSPLLLLVVPAAAYAAPKSFADLADMFVTLMNNAVVVLVVLGLVVYFYGISTNILSIRAGGEGSEKIKAYFFWGIIVLFVMVSVWGILQLLQNSLFGGDQFNNSTPTDTLQADPASFNSPAFTE